MPTEHLTRPTADGDGAQPVDGAPVLSLDTYRLLGGSGLRVSPVGLGTMTFGTDWGWGAEPGEARGIFDAYVDRGGNFVDTANAYTNGTAERLVGEFASGHRDRLVIATKCTVATRPGDPNSGGNHRKSIVNAVEASLERLRTDYVDLLYLHAWDGTTPVEEVVRAMDALVRAGKVLYLGISNTPAWQVARMRTIADLRGWEPLTAVQIEYSLIERTAEAELIPMASELGLGLVTFMPLAGGVLTGKYHEADLGHDGEMGTRKGVAIENRSLTKRGLAIADVVAEVAAEIERTPPQVALAWTLLNPAVTAPLVGARTLAQFQENLGALEVALTDNQRARLDDASAIELGHPHEFLARPLTHHVMHGGTTIANRAPT